MRLVVFRFRVALIARTESDLVNVEAVRVPAWSSLVFHEKIGPLLRRMQMVVLRFSPFHLCTTLCCTGVSSCQPLARRRDQLSEVPNGYLLQRSFGQVCLALLVCLSACSSFLVCVTVSSAPFPCRFATALLLV
jgi:hypothetical protein